MRSRRFACAVVAAGLPVLGAAPAAWAAPAGGPGSIVTVREGNGHGGVRVVRFPRGSVGTGLGGSVRTGDPWEVTAGAFLLAGAASGTGVAVHRRRRAARAA